MTSAVCPPPLSAAGPWLLRISLAMLLPLGSGTVAAGPAAAAPPAFEVQPALVFSPDPPRAGAALEVSLAEDLIAPGRIVRLLDAQRDVPLDEQLLGRFGSGTLTLQLPADVSAIALVLMDDSGELLRWPTRGALPVTPAGDSPQFLPARRAPQRDAGQRSDTQCGALPPDAGAARELLHDWLLHCPLASAPLRDRDLRGIDLRGRDLQRADLRGADLADAQLAGANLSGALLLGARLDGADLSNADLEVADLGHASLFVTELAGARLRGADLRAVVATSTSFANADLTGARFSGARLDGVDFTGAICPDGTRTLSRCDDHMELP